MMKKKERKKRTEGEEMQSESFDISRIQSKAYIMVRGYIKKRVREREREEEERKRGNRRCRRRREKETEEQSGRSERGIARK